MLVPYLGVFSLLATIYLAATNWADLSFASIMWLLLSLVLASAMLGARQIGERYLKCPIRAAKVAALGSVCFGLLWGSSMAVLPHHFDETMMLAVLVLGLIMLAPYALVKAGFLASFTGMSLASGAAPLSAATLVFILALGLPAIVIAARRRYKTIHLRQAYQQARFERVASWTWQTNDKGNLVEASENFFTGAGIAPQHAIGKPLVKIADVDTADESLRRNREALLYFHDIQLPFADLGLGVRIGRETHHWSFSGRPRYDTEGVFAGFTGVGFDATEDVRAGETLRSLAERDPLTELANRNSIRGTLENELAERGSGGSGLAVMLVDLDRFKHVNDTLGHQLGDKLILQVAKRLQTFISTEGYVGRLGGDEFVIILPRLSQRVQLDSLASRLIEYVSAPYDLNGHRLVIGATIGIAVSPEDGDTVDRILHNADLALYTAKEYGGGEHRFFERMMLVDAEKRREMERDLRAAIENGDFSLQFQPIIEPGSGKLRGFEALARWFHPDKGPISPDEFIPLAENAGIIDLIGDWVLRNACEAATAWPEDIILAVNLSPTQIANPNLAKSVIKCLKTTGLEPRRLELEITENVFLHETQTTQTTLAELHTHGVKWALDDFGTGYSSLAYLLKAPFSTIKIDRTFIEGLSVPESPKVAIVQSIVALARSLGMKATAEGVETHNDLEVVSKLGCSHVQGFIYGSGLNAEEALSLTKTRQAVEPRGHKATRRENRHQVCRSADVFFDADQHFAKVRNISRHGAMIETDCETEIGVEVRIAIGKDIVRKGTVRWVSGNRFGVEFYEPYDHPAVRPPMAPPANDGRLTAVA